MFSNQKPKFQKSKLVLAIAAAFMGVGLVTLAGCDGGGDTSSGDTNAIYHKTYEPTGTVMGAVKDSNGNPIVGANVYVGSFKTTTNEGGSFSFTKVPVMNVAGSDNAGPGVNPNLIVTVSPPSPTDAKGKPLVDENGKPVAPIYLGASVGVTPQAQIDDATNNINNNTGTVTVSTGVTAFIDGFSVSTGTIVLPEIGASVAGYLRDAISGMPIPNTPVSIDLASVGGNSTVATTGVAVSWTSDRWGAITGADGRFMITNVPKDSGFDFIVGSDTWGFDTTADGAADQTASLALINTTPETETVEYGNINVVRFVKTDKTRPYVTRVNDIVTVTDNGRAILADGVDGLAKPVVVNFSEPLSPDGVIRAGAIRLVTIAKNGTVTDIGATGALAGTTLTITTTGEAAIPDSTSFDLLLNVADFLDTAAPANLLAEDETIKDNKGDNLVRRPIAYDELTANSQYLRLTLSTYVEPNTTTDPVGVIKQLTLDKSTDLSTLEKMSTAFLDVDDISAGVNNLNSGEDSDGDKMFDAHERIAALAEKINTDVLGNTSNQFYNGSVFPTVPTGTSAARILFVPGEAASFNLQVRDQSGNLLVLDPANAGQQVNVTGTQGIVLPNTNPPAPGMLYPDKFTANFAIDQENNRLLFPGDPNDDPLNNGSVEIVLSNMPNFLGVAPDTVVYISPVDGFGYVGRDKMKSLTLKDNVAPTTVLQRSYDAQNNATVDPEIDLRFGEGGELSDTGGDTKAVPILGITPRLLNIDNSNSPGTNAYLNFPATLQEELCKYEGAPFSSERNIYDATAWDKFNAATDNKGRTIGIAFSENVKLSGTPTIGDLNAGVTLDGWTENMDVVVNADVIIDNQKLFDGADLINVNTNDVMALANLNNNAVIDFTGVIKDMVDNAADANATAKVVVRDKMPPFVTKAQYTGDKVVIEFNEPVNLDMGTKIALMNDEFGTITAEYIVPSRFSSGETNQIELPNIGWIKNGSATFDNDSYLSRANVFAAISYPEDVYTSLAGANSHAVLDFGDVADTMGNKWNDAVKNLGMTKPLFAAIDTVGPMVITNSSAAAGTVSFEFSHPLQVARSNLAIQDGVVAAIDTPDIQRAFEIKQANGNFVPITVTAVRWEQMTLSFDFTTAVVLAVDDEIVLTRDGKLLNLVFQSAYSPADEGVAAGSVTAIKLK